MSTTTKAAPMTFADWTEQYLRDHVKPVCKPSAAAHFEDNLMKHAVPALGKLPLREIDAPTLQRFLNQQAAHGRLRDGGPLSEKSVKNLRTALSRCFTMAVAMGELSSNPVPSTVIRRTPKPEVQTMAEEEQKKLMEFLLQDPGLMNIGILLMARLAIRRGEACGLQWRDFDSGYLRIRRTVKRLPNEDPEGPKTVLVFGDAKTESSMRNLALPPDLCQLLQLQRERFARLFGREPETEDFIIFNTAGTVTDPDNLTHYFSDVLAGLGLRHVKLHALRHTFASQAVARGIDVATVSGLLGHTNVTTTTYYYLHPKQDAMNQALWQLAAAKGAPPGGILPTALGTSKPHRFTRRATFEEVRN